MDSYLRFVLLPRTAGRKTDQWSVVSISGNHLGRVHWWSHWRQYVFEPDNDTVFNKDCMVEIAAFCETATIDHRENSKL